MADSIPSLRRQLAEVNAELQALKSQPPVEVVREVVRTVEVPVEVVREVEKRVEVPVYVEVERVRYERVEVPTQVYVTDPELEVTIRELQEALRLCSQSGS